MRGRYKTNANLSPMLEHKHINLDKIKKPGVDTYKLDVNKVQ